MTLQSSIYKGYEIRRIDGVNFKFAIYDPRWPNSPIRFEESKTIAKGWIEAYRKGATWAVLEAMNTEERV